MMGSHPCGYSGSIEWVGNNHEIEEVEPNVYLGIEDIALQLKYGNGEEVEAALSGLQMLLEDQATEHELLGDERIIPILFKRLSSADSDECLGMLRALRSIASRNAETKEKMADLNCLTTLAKFLTQDDEEQTEAVGLLLELAERPSVRRRIGRIRGCILMLVTILNCENPVASRDSGKLLNLLAKNTQNALHMAEAGYSKPLIQHLKEGSEMTKILMATSLSRMALTNQAGSSLGENGAIEPLITMLKTGKLEAKSSSINALRNLSKFEENIPHMFASGILSPLLQLLFSVTSSLMSLQEAASSLLASISKSESVMLKKDLVGQMFTLLNLSSPSIQIHILQTLNNMAVHPTTRGCSSTGGAGSSEMKRSGAIQLLLPFLSESNTKIRSKALRLLYTITNDSPVNLAEMLGERNLEILLRIVSSPSVSESEKAGAVGLLGNIPVSDKKTTDLLKKANLLPTLISIINSTSQNPTPTTRWLEESVASILIRFTISSDEKLQLYALELGVAPLLVKLLSGSSSITVKALAVKSLVQLSQNSTSPRTSRVSKWYCIPVPQDGLCSVHGWSCSTKGGFGFCLIKSGAVQPLINVLEGKEREADEEVLHAISTLLQDPVWERGSEYIAKEVGIGAFVKVLELGSVKAKQQALWIMDKIFRLEAHRVEYGDCAQLVLINLARKGDPSLKPMIAKLLAQLELLQVQTTCF